MADPIYGVEHSGNTPGAETLIILNGPIIKDLRFNYEQGVMRDGFMPNTSVGRFWRLALRNMAGFLPHKTDKARSATPSASCSPRTKTRSRRSAGRRTASTWASRRATTPSRSRALTGGGVLPSVTGSTPEAMMPYLADGVAEQTGWEIVFTVGGLSIGTLRPVLILSPILAETIAQGRLEQGRREALSLRSRAHAGMARRGVHREMGRLPDRVAQASGQSRPSCRGHSHESDDPNRMVPIVLEPDDFMVLVSGDPLRTNAYSFTHNGYLGFPVAKKIQLPKDWAERISNATRSSPRAS